MAHPADGMNDTGAEPSEAPEGPAGGRPRRGGLRRAMRYVALGTAMALAAAAVGGWLLYRRLDGNIHADRATAGLLADPQVSRPASGPKGAQNILIIGSDLRPGGDSERSDTVILLHVAADRSRATAMSVPRDLMVDVPSCRLADGTAKPARYEQFNWAFELAGPSCTIRTFEKLTDIRVDHHVVLHFEDFKRIINAVGGVRMCLPEPEKDVDVGLDLPVGCQVLRDENALAYVRARKGVADGSDTHRMARQQAFLAELFREATSKGVLLNPARLYSLLDSGTSALTTDPGLASLSQLYAFADSLRGIPPEKVTFLTLPRRPYPADPDRDVVAQPAADDLFRQLREDRPTG